MRAIVWGAISAYAPMYIDRRAARRGGAALALRRDRREAAALATTILANALRAYGTMVAADIWGIEAAGGIDHIFYGWIFFGLVILIVMLVARRWFDRPANDAAVDVRGLEGPIRFAGPGRAVLPAALLFGGSSTSTASEERSTGLATRSCLTHPCCAINAHRFGCHSTCRDHRLAWICGKYGQTVLKCSGPP